MSQKQKHGRTYVEVNKETVWATRTQLANRYSVHPRTVDDWRRAGRITAYVYSKRLVRFELKECDEFFKSLRIIES